MGRRLRGINAKVCCFLYARTCRSSKRRACLSRCQSSVSRAACDEHNRSLARLLCLRCAPIAPACLVPAPLPPPSPPHSLTTATPQLHHTAATQPPHRRRHINGLHNVTRPTHTTRLLLDALPRLLVLTLPLGCTLGGTLCAPYGYTMGGREGRGEGSVNRRGRGQGALTRLYTLQWGMTRERWGLLGRGREEKGGLRSGRKRQGRGKGGRVAGGGGQLGRWSMLTRARICPGRTCRRGDPHHDLEQRTLRLGCGLGALLCQRDRLLPGGVA